MKALLPQPLPYAALPYPVLSLDLPRVLSVAGNQAVPAQCVAVVVDESGRRFAAIIPTLALPKKAIVGSTLWASMLRRRL